MSYGDPPTEWEVAILVSKGARQQMARCRKKVPMAVLCVAMNAW